MLDAYPLARVLTSIPGIGVRTGARILLDVGDATAFPTPAPGRLRRPGTGHPPLRQQHPQLDRSPY